MESGGQICDHGVIKLGNSGQQGKEEQYRMKVTDVQMHDGILWHLGIVTSCPSSSFTNDNTTIDVSQGTLASYHINAHRRQEISNNHTATHLLNAALRTAVVNNCSTSQPQHNTVSTHAEETEETEEETVSSTDGLCDQRGSLVKADSFRFDFTLERGLTVEEITTIEGIVNNDIAQRRNLYIDQVPLQDALNNITQLRAVFGEAYPDPVRVVSVGTPIDILLQQREAHADDASVDASVMQGTSVELCGGTHVDNTKALGGFVIVEEKGIAKGVRRLVCLTGRHAQQAIENGTLLLQQVAVLETQLVVDHNYAHVDRALRKITEIVEGGGSGGGSEGDSGGGSGTSHRPTTRVLLPYAVNIELKHRILKMNKMVALHVKEQGKQHELTFRTELEEQMQVPGTSAVYAMMARGSRGEEGVHVNPKAMRKILTKVMKKKKKRESTTGRVADNRIELAEDVSNMFVVADGPKGKFACYAMCGGGGGALNASDWMKRVMEECGGKGGGRQEWAQGTHVEDAEKASTVALEYYNEVREKNQ